MAGDRPVGFIQAPEELNQIQLEQIQLVVRTRDHQISSPSHLPLGHASSLPRFPCHSRLMLNGDLSLSKQVEFGRWKNSLDIHTKVGQCLMYSFCQLISVLLFNHYCPFAFVRSLLRSFIMFFCSLMEDGWWIRVRYVQYLSVNICFTKKKRRKKDIELRDN